MSTWVQVLGSTLNKTKTKQKTSRVSVPACHSQQWRGGDSRNPWAQIWEPKVPVRHLVPKQYVWMTPEEHSDTQTWPVTLPCPTLPKKSSWGSDSHSLHHVFLLSSLSNTPKGICCFISTSGLSKYSLNGQTLAVQDSVALWGLLHLLNSALLRESSYWQQSSNS